MNTIDIEAIQAKFDEIVKNFGTTQDDFIPEDFINENSVILEEINGGSGVQKVFLTVTTFDDQNDGNASNGLSLRDAVLIAQRDPRREYVINLPEGTYNLTIEGNQDFLFQEQSETNLGQFDNIVARSGDLDIETRITIIGSNPNNTIIDASTLGDRIFDVRENGFLSLQNITIQNGITLGTFAEDSIEPLDPDSFAGGGIRIDINGAGEINNSIIKGNQTRWDRVTQEANINGGGISNEGLLTINNTTIIDNSSEVNAGGIYNSGNLQITNSSVANNSANVFIFYVDKIEGGGGILNTNGGTLIVTNSTISGNKTILSGNETQTFPNGAGGGGILSDGGPAVIINSTIVNNNAPVGAGILISKPEDGEATPAILQNSIVALNQNITSGNTFSSDIEGFFELNSSYNLIGNANGILFDGIENNKVGTITNPLDPNIGPLQFNGGLTPTHALLENSPAINAGSNAIANGEQLNLNPLTTDQRGYDRIVNGTVDIGSYEFYQNSSLLNTPIYRFQNTSLPGTYLFAGEGERQSIKQNNPNFVEEGFAFSVAVQPGDDLIPIYRFQNTSIAGTYLYTGEQERQSIKQNNPNFVEEGLAFYVFGSQSNEGQSFYRFQNSDLPGTYLFVGGGERLNIKENFPNFIEEGIAFKAGV
ncbi:alkaline phosphatase [Geminocystis sp. NIES-3708]|uniref:choice-of-anchor Q domain-containing protein n=1 Tax=Geminocystis sp. NIES-3708 TaxID=1615909 RepID=UPI0005FCAA38|nr:choice-of-anchor Q domain-containing protein [Geminocystis sp. NIES-3708]BAQ60146.1 alkaline phosphatase [Geminocystis sp. NIES-3708]